MATGGIREYARYRGCDAALISRYSDSTQDGRLCGALIGTDGQRKLLDFDKADALLEAYGPAGRNGAAKDSSFMAARTARESYQARLAHLEFEQKSGKLVEQDAVKVAAFNLARRVREAIQNIPHRCAAQARAAGSDHEAVAIMNAQIAEALEALTDTQL
ncbi:MAG: hypothetical protein ACR2RB_18395 [Gammaproteobacteria bacterium]